jgi:hypothetical protein
MSAVHDGLPWIVCSQGLAGRRAWRWKQSRLNRDTATSSPPASTWTIDLLAGDYRCAVGLIDADQATAAMVAAQDVTRPRAQFLPAGSRRSVLE